MDDTVKSAFPSYALAIEPVPRYENGLPIIEECQFYAVGSDDGTPFLILFRKKNLVAMFLEELRPDWESVTIPIPTEDHLSFLIGMLRKLYLRPVGVLLDPDGQLQGYPLPPENWPEQDEDRSEDEDA